MAGVGEMETEGRGVTEGDPEGVRETVGEADGVDPASRAANFTLRVSLYPVTA